MQGMAIISTEEYKELINAQRDAEESRDAFKELLEIQIATNKELQELKTEFDCLLRRLTGGKEVIKWEDGKLEPFDLADRQVITDYFNENYVKNGKILFKGE